MAQNASESISDEKGKSQNINTVVKMVKISHLEAIEFIFVS